MAVDYESIEEALSLSLVASIPHIQNVFVEGTEVEILNTSNMPLINIRLIESVIPTEYISSGYIENIHFALDILTFDFTSFTDATILRSTIVTAIRDFLASNPQIASDAMSSQMGPSIIFSTPENGNPGHISMASLTLIFSAYGE